MFAKRLFLKATHRHLHHEKSSLTSEDVGFRIDVHYGIPSTASILAFDPIQRLLAVGTLDGRIKVIGGNNIEGLLISPKLLPYKFLEFLQNQGILISIMNDNDIQIWNLERRSITCSLQWESNVTAFSVISGSSFIYVGDEHGLMSVLKYDATCEQLLRLPYHLSSDSLSEAAKYPFAYHRPIVGVLPQPCSSGNRLIIAYESGLIILWDVIQSHIVDVRGDKVLQLKSEVVSENTLDASNVDETSSNDLEEKEISSLCWASSDGSILGVGYVDGDILFWNGFKATSRKEQKYGFSKNVVKLQLSSSQKRLPVVVLHWMAENKSKNQVNGRLLIYGGDGIGCEEAVTVLSLEWTSGTEVLRCIGRVDLTLAGSFADMIIIPSSATTRSKEDTSLFVLSNAGQIHVFESASLSSPSLQRRKELPSSAVKLPVCIQTVDPLMTVADLFYLYGSRKRQSTIVEMTNYRSTQTMSGDQKWRLTGGVGNHISFAKNNKVDKLYIAGYQDGSVRIWDATYPVFSFFCVLTAEACCEGMVSSGAPVSEMDFCSSTLRLAVGNECGLVKLYNLSRSEDSSFHYVTETKHEVSNSAPVEGPWCEAVINLHKSGVQKLKFTNEGTKLIVGYEFAKIAVLDLNSWSRIALILDSISSQNAPMVSVLWEAFISNSVRNTNEPTPIIPDIATAELVFVLTKNANIYVINANKGSLINSRPLHLKKESSAISLYIIESHKRFSLAANEEQIVKDDVSQNDTAQGSEKCETDTHYSDKNPPGEIMKESLFLLCCEDALRMYPVKSVMNGENKYIHKVKLVKPCCWTSLLRKDEKVCGLVVFYQTGEIEIRSVTDLKMVKEYSLMSDLRWNFQANMERTFSSTDNGQIMMAYGCEVAFISLLTGKSDFWIPGSQPNLHDEVFAAAADTAISISSKSKLKQGANPGILGGVVKGLKGKKSSKLANISSTSKFKFSHLEDVFARNPFLEPSMTTSEQEARELTIDDIEIDELVPLESTLSHEVKNGDKDKKTEREKLFDGGADVKPRVRTREEIEAIYRKNGDASSVAGEARNKLLERQQKLEKTRRQTEELQNEAKEFASLTDELVKAMENRKWYHI
ncbi:uncharacterized protein [Primulina eburnea]|uniref:uncharacterized protein isoform X1 n=3 Tax=Primulina eburnea TaxID=1245227 RepID=UPI003C6BDC4B